MAIRPTPGALGTIAATALRAEALIDPIGIDAPAPRLSWTMASDNANEHPSGYQVRVATSLPLLRHGGPLVWDSGRLSSAQESQVAYQGMTLASGQRYVWWVRLWDSTGLPGPWSAPATWTMGLLDDAAWDRAAWIAPSSSPSPAAASLRRPFTLAGCQATRAILTIASLGFHVPYLNGSRVDDAELAPSWTDYLNRILYVTRDVTNLVRSDGDNTLGVDLAGGWYKPGSADVWGFQAMPYTGPEQLRAHLAVQCADGGQRTVVSDGQWQWARGDVTYSSIRGGEDIDHRKSLGDWSRPSAAAAPFSAVTTRVSPKGSPRLVASTIPPERKTATVATTARKTKAGYLYTMQENAAASVTVSLTGSPQTTVRLQVGEGLAGDVVDPSWHDLNATTVGNRWQQINLTLASSRRESFSTTFTYFAGSYISLQVLSGNLTAPPEITVSAIHTDVESTGSFESSDPRLNRLHDAFRRTYLNNLHGYPTDCPQRERLGYGADGTTTSESALLNFDTVGVYEKWMADFRDAQAPNGYVPFTVPAYPRQNSYWWSPWWGNAIVAVPLTLYRYQGGEELLARQYPAVKRYVDYLLGRLVGDRWDADAFPPDHEAVDAADSRQFNTLGVLAALDDVVRVAAALNLPTDADHYRAAFTRVRTSFNERWFDQTRGTYRRGAPTAAFQPAPQSVLAVALAIGVVPDSRVPAVLAALKSDIAAPFVGTGYADHLLTGIIGTRYLFSVLTDSDNPDPAYRLLTKAGYPGVLPAVEEAGGTLHERIVNDDLSHDHPMFGSYDAWLFRGLAGLRVDQLPATGTIQIRPGLATGVEWAKAAVTTPRGPAASAWKRTGSGVEYTVTVPPASTANVSVTARAGAVVVDGKATRTTTDPAAATRQTVRLGAGMHVIIVAE